MNTCEHDFDYILDGNWECTKCAAEFSDEDKKDWQYQHLEQQLTQAQQTIEEYKKEIQTLKQQLGESEQQKHYWKAQARHATDKLASKE